MIARLAFQICLIAGICVAAGTRTIAQLQPRSTATVRLSALKLARQDSDEATKRELTDLLQQFAAASIRGDDAFFDRVLADDYTFITTKGEYKNKAQALADYRSHSIKFHSHVFDQIDVRLYGETAVVTNRAVSVSSFKGRPRNGVTRNTRVFVRRDGRWQCVVFQSTDVQDAKPRK
jgi:uncharacterized protein (TIGR02246 family)